MQKFKLTTFHNYSRLVLYSLRLNFHCNLKYGLLNFISINVVIFKRINIDGNEFATWQKYNITIDSTENQNLCARNISKWGLKLIKRTQIYNDDDNRCKCANHDD